MTELVICSGKGGTGKTSVTAAFAALSPDAVLADCDVDAADLHLLLAPAAFYSLARAWGLERLPAWAAGVLYAWGIKRYTGAQVDDTLMSAGKPSSSQP